MKAINIEFADSSIAHAVVRITGLSWLFLFAGLTLTATAGMATADLVTQKEKQATALAGAQSQLVKRTARAPVTQKFVVPDAQATAINIVVAQLNLPWRDLLDAVEAATPASIALIALEPDAKKHVIRGTAEAKTNDTMIAYIESLKKQGFLDSVSLIRHEINEQDPNKPLRFQFEAHWHEAIR